jgi:hypothetical protein
MVIRDFRDLCDYERFSRMPIFSTRANAGLSAVAKMLIVYVEGNPAQEIPPRRSENSEPQKYGKVEPPPQRQ